ncbi:polynucleotide kinase 3 phosphatase-domain-containing protein [Russula brevipes]|nr:polynucleotide kinase 3 phosphatase-domain-containing protein [Russula brevipes]
MSAFNSIRAGVASSSSVKRERDHPGGSPDAKPFRWLTPALGPTRSCLHGVHLSPTASSRVAAFDLDSTVIKSSFVQVGRAGSKGGKRVIKKQTNGGGWEWWRAVVPQKLQEAHDSGFSVIPELPFRIFAATSKDGHRKPMPGMWFELERIFAQDGVTIDKSTSYYVGDAAGRTNDFASTDRKFALNVGVQFYTPEEYFLKISPAPYTLPGFHVSSLKEYPQDSQATVVLPPDLETEIVVFVGPPCLGKSTFYRTHFAPAGYVHVNQDTLGSRPKCVKAAEEALTAGRSCVIDNTNRDVQTRKHYLDLAKRLQVPARCFVFQGSIELAWHNNLYRAYARPASVVARESTRELIPYAALMGFADAHEVPSVKEGFVERRHWSMWLQINGK